MNSFLNKIVIKAIEMFLRFLQVQLFITLVSLPLIGWWRLPLSLMAIVGNFIFTPWVILFIIISTLIFFTELFCIPNDWLIAILEMVTRSWYYILSWGKSSWVFGISYKLWGLTIVLALGAIAIICHKKWGQLIESVLLLGCLYGAFIISWYCITPCANFTILNKHNSHLYIVSDHNQILLYDEDYLRRIRSPESWVEFTFIPLLLHNTGCMTINKIVINSFTPQISKILTYLIEYAQVDTIVIPYFSENLADHEWKNFFKMHKKAEMKGVNIERIITCPDKNKNLKVEKNQKN